jgi:hypothetical protein
MNGKCELCEREPIKLTKHHVIPVTRHPNKKTKRETSRDDRHKVAWICRPCHDQIHVLISEKDMEREYNTIEKLKSHPGVQKFILWVQNKTF